MTNVGTVIKRYLPGTLLVNIIFMSCLSDTVINLANWIDICMNCCCIELHLAIALLVFFLEIADKLKIMIAQVFRFLGNGRANNDKSLYFDILLALHQTLIF